MLLESKKEAFISEISRCFYFASRNQVDREYSSLYNARRFQVFTIISKVKGTFFLQKIAMSL